MEPKRAKEKPVTADLHRMNMVKDGGEYNSETVHEPGILNPNADALNRIYITENLMKYPITENMSEKPRMERKTTVTVTEIPNEIDTREPNANGERENRTTGKGVIDRINTVTTRATTKRKHVEAAENTEETKENENRESKIAKYYLSEERIDRLRKKNFEVMIRFIDNESNAKDKTYYKPDMFSDEIGKLHEFSKSQYLIYLPGECGELVNKNNIEKAVIDIQRMCEKRNVKRLAIILSKYGPEFYFQLNKRIEELIAQERRYVTIFFDEIIHLHDVKDIEKVIKAFHDAPIGGHLGVKHTIDRLKLKYGWPKLAKTVTKYIEKGDKCQRKKIIVHTKMPMKITSTAREPFEKISMDIVGPIAQSEKGNKYILTIMDELTKFAEAVPIKDAESNTVAEAFVHTKKD